MRRRRPSVWNHEHTRGLKHYARRRKRDLMERHETEQRPEWPPPQPDPDREPSHPGARDDDRDEGWWERWQEEERRGADT